MARKTNANDDDMDGMAEFEWKIPVFIIEKNCRNSETGYFCGIIKIEVDKGGKRGTI